VYQQSVVAGSATICPRSLTIGSNEKSKSRNSTCICKHTVAVSTTSFSDAIHKYKLGFPNLVGNASRQKPKSSTISTFSLVKPYHECCIGFKVSAEV